MRKKILFVLAVLAIVGCMGACSSHDAIQSKQSDGYITDSRMNELDYKMFINEKLVNTQELIHTRMTVIQNIDNGEYPIKDEITNTDQAIKIIQDYINDISVTRPPQLREEKQTQIMQNLANAKATLETYLKALQSGDLEKAKNSATVMKSDYELLGTSGL